MEFFPFIVKTYGTETGGAVVLWLVTVTSHQQDRGVEFTCSPSVCVGYHWVLLTSSHSTKTCMLS